MNKAKNTHIKMLTLTSHTQLVRIFFENGEIMLISIVYSETYNNCVLQQQKCERKTSNRHIKDTHTHTRPCDVYVLVMAFDVVRCWRCC